MTGSRNDALIKGGQIVDGTGAKPFTGDVRVADGKIVEIGSNLTARTEPTFDASGCYVTPGFIDTHAHYDGSLFWDPACDPITLHGVTTVLIGNCGLGLAPVHKEQIKGLAHLFSYIEDIPRDVFETAVPWSWDSFPQYAKIMRTRTFGVNVATLISHSLLRTDVLGDDAWKRSSTPEEAGRIAKTYDEALAAGAFGFSTSNFDRSPSGDPVPSCHGDQHEFEQLFAVTAKHKGIVQVIPDLSSMDNQERDLRRLGDLSSRHGGVPVISNGIYQRPDKPDYASRMMSVARDIRSKGANFHFLASPRSIDLVVNMREAMVFLYVPAWNEITQPDVSDAELERLHAAGVRGARVMQLGGAVRMDQLLPVNARIAPIGWHPIVQFDGREIFQYKALLEKIQGN